MADSARISDLDDTGHVLMHGSLENQEFPCITAFFDESGHSSSTRIVAMGGAMTSPKRWGDLRVRWKAALQRYGIRVFHMTDFENRRGEFEGWNEAKRRKLLTELFGALAECPLFVIGAVVVVNDFNKLPSTGLKELRDPWYLCYQSCFHEALTCSLLFADPKKEGIELEDTRIRACFYETHRQYTWGPVLFRIAQEARKESAAAYSNGIIGFGSKQSTVHFQVADLIAYELRKHVENALYKQGRPTRWPMRQFLKGMMMVNVFTNTSIDVPTEGGFAVFRFGPFTDSTQGEPINAARSGAQHPRGLAHRPITGSLPWKSVTELLLRPSLRPAHAAKVCRPSLICPERTGAPSFPARRIPPTSETQGLKRVRHKTLGGRSHPASASPAMPPRQHIRSLYSPHSTNPREEVCSRVRCCSRS